MSKFIINNANVKVLTDEEILIENSLPLGVYNVRENPLSHELYLEKRVEFSEPNKVYGDTNTKIERIINTFKERNKNMGVLLSGVKGSGKTFLAKGVASRLLKENYPTLIVNEVFDPNNLSDFIQAIGQPCVILFDEFEKIYKKKNGDNNIQDGLLSLLDGLFNTKMLFMFTCNESGRISDLFIDRPSRVFYHLKFEGMSEDAIRDYCEENLIDKSKIDEILEVRRVVDIITFDILQSLVDEINRYGETPQEVLALLNVTVSASGKNYKIDLKPLNPDDNFDKCEGEIYCNVFKTFSIDIAHCNGDGELEWDEDTTFDFAQHFVNRKGEVYKLRNDKYEVVLSPVKHRTFNALDVLNY